MGGNDAREKTQPQERLQCPECGSADVRTRLERQQFPYGQGKDAVELEVVIPVRRCSACGSEYLDDSAETIRHEAVCRHLGALTPEDIRRLRDGYGLSRAEFARLTRLGEATLSRWESGVLVQNAAYDEYLRLLFYADNVRRLQVRDLARRNGSHGKVVAIASYRYRALNNDERMSKEGQTFQLRKAGAAR
jgi:putative zinc finger/helix-turn-helix YgiT family protein